MIEKYLDKKIFTLYFFPLVLGSLSVFSFQPFNLTIINFIILPLFFYLIVYINKKSKSIYRIKPHKKNLFILGTVFGFGYYFSGIHWISHSLTFDENFQYLIPLSLTIIPLFLSLFFSLVTFSIGPYLKFNYASVLLFSGSLAFSDYLRAKILTGFPWNLWVYSFSWSTEILQILNKIGLFAFNLILITALLSPAILFFNNISKIKKFIIIILLSLSILCLFLYGSYSINKNKIFLESVHENIKIKVVSPNFELKYGITIKEAENRLEKLLRYSEPNKSLKTLFVWPEGVFGGFSYSELTIFKKKFEENFSKGHFIIFGTNRFNIEKLGLYNSLIIVNNKFEIIQEYKKQKLVPFGEFLPLEKILNKFGLKKITEGYGSFLRGESQNNLVLNGLNILPLICYEVIFTEFIQQSNANTNLIINISEDAWFGNSIGPYQHFAKGIFRAIEKNSFLIRSTNKGKSAIINNKGEVIKELNGNETGNIELDVPLIKRENKNKNDLIFFALLITYIFIFTFNKIKNEK